MINLQTRPVLFANQPQPTQPTPPSNPTPPPQDPQNPQDGHHNVDHENFSWLDLGKGITGSLIGGTIEGAGAAVAGLVKTPRITLEAIRGVWKSKMLGPVLKSTLTPVILAAGLLTPILTTIGGIGYGMFEGFQEGSEKNPLAAGSKAVETCKQMHGKVTQQIIDGIREAATKEPTSPDEVYEIKVIEAGTGLVSSAATAAIDAVGAAGSVALHVPCGYYKISKELWQSDTALPLKVGGQFLATAGAVLAVPLAAVGGALYGLGTGAYNGYQKGFVESVKSAGSDMVKLNDALNEAVK